MDENEFDIAIIGGGVGGLVTASGASQLGAKVALVEKERLGGDCLHYGCVPTKTLIHTAKIISLMKRAEEFGINPVKVDFEFKKIMDHMRDIQARVGEHDAPERFERMGVKLFFGQGEFKDNHTFRVNGTDIKSKKFLIATGSRPAKVPIEGLEKVNYLDNTTILKLDRLPESMIVLGAGPIGLEFAQTFSRFGTKVTVIEKGRGVLPKEDSELTENLRTLLEQDGLEIITCVDTKKIEQEGNTKLVYAECTGKELVMKAEELFVAIGRAPNIEGFGLDNAGVETRRTGIIVDDSMKTTASNIWACGDVIGMFPFTHMAEYEAGLVIGNALFPLINRKIDKINIPWATFTDPELARVGLTELEAREKYGNIIKVYKYRFQDHDRAVMDGEPNGLIKLVCKSDGSILGAHILGFEAANLIPEYVLAMKNKIPVQKISQAVHVYPTMGQIAKRGADQYYREKLFSGWIPKMAKLFVGH